MRVDCMKQCKAMDAIYLSHLPCYSISPPEADSRCSAIACGSTRSRYPHTQHTRPAIERVQIQFVLNREHEIAKQCLAKGQKDQALLALSCSSCPSVCVRAAGACLA